MSKGFREVGLHVKVSHHCIGPPAPKKFDGGDIDIAVEHGRGTRGTQGTRRHVDVKGLGGSMQAQLGSELLRRDGTGLFSRVKVLVEGGGRRGKVFPEMEDQAGSGTDRTHVLMRGGALPYDFTGDAVLLPRKV